MTRFAFLKYYNQHCQVLLCARFGPECFPIVPHWILNMGGGNRYSHFVDEGEKLDHSAESPQQGALGPVPRTTKTHSTHPPLQPQKVGITILAALQMGKQA